VERKPTVWIVQRKATRLIKDRNDTCEYSKWWADNYNSSPYFTFSDQQVIHDAMAWSMFTMFWPAIGLYALVGTSDGAPWSPINENRPAPQLQE
jgi:hypothetical protein